MKQLAASENRLELTELLSLIIMWKIRKRVKCSDTSVSAVSSALKNAGMKGLLS